MAPSFEELWRGAISARIRAVFADIRRGAYGAIEFVFADDQVIKLTIEHLGLSSYAAPIFPNEWVSRVPLDWACVGQMVTAVELWRHQRHGGVLALRITLSDGAMSFRFENESVVLETPARGAEGASDRLA